MTISTCKTISDYMIDITTVRDHFDLALSSLASFSSVIVLFLGEVAGTVLLNLGNLHINVKRVGWTTLVQQSYERRHKRTKLSGLTFAVILLASFSGLCCILPTFFSLAGEYRWKLIELLFKRCGDRGLSVLSDE